MLLSTLRNLQYFRVIYLQDGGDGNPTTLHNIMEEKLELEAKISPLVHPGKGYFVISPGETVLQHYEDMSFSGDLVPMFVKLKLKEALKKALELPDYFKGNCNNKLSYVTYLLFSRRC